MRGYEFTILNGTRDRRELDPLVEQELNRTASVLGHPARRVLAHYITAARSAAQNTQSCLGHSAPNLREAQPLFGVGR